jgi:hypothetical protein
VVAVELTVPQQNQLTLVALVVAVLVDQIQ